MGFFLLLIYFVTMKIINFVIQKKKEGIFFLRDSKGLFFLNASFTHFFDFVKFFNRQMFILSIFVLDFNHTERGKIPFFFFLFY